MRPITPTDEDLLAAIDGEPEAFAELYRRYERVVLAYHRRRVASPELAVDLASETFAAALAALRSGQGPRGAFGSWLLGIARHKLRVVGTIDQPDTSVEAISAALDRALARR